jgi:hypothetical protein
MSNDQRAFCHWLDVSPEVVFWAPQGAMGDTLVWMDAFLPNNHTR